jgi:molecular chaperone GrpE
LFSKKRKTMSEKNNGHPEEGLAESPSARQAKEAAEELLHASEAAAEHTMDAPDNALVEELERLRNELNTTNDKYLRLVAEFDNFRKRNAKERTDLLTFAGENAFKNVLPVVDDMERAIKNNASVTDVDVVKQGFTLIHGKLLQILGAQGIRPMNDLVGQPFDTDRHEAITKAPAPSPDLKGKVIDVIENGYTMHDKVVRFAKVVVG